MAKVSSKLSRGRSSRPSPRAELYEQRKAEWEAKVRSPLKTEWDMYGVELAPGERPEYVDGRKLVTDLTRLFSLTRDPIFAHVVEVIRAYGLDKASPARAVRSLRRRLGKDDLSFFVEKMEGYETSERDAAEAVAAKFGLSAPSFDTARDKLRKAFAKGVSINFGDANIGDTGAYWSSGEQKENVPEEIPDNLDGRSRIYARRNRAKSPVNPMGKSNPGS